MIKLAVGPYHKWTIRAAGLSIALTWRGGRSIAAIDVESEVAVTGDIVEQQAVRAGLLDHHVVPAIQIIGAAFRARVLAPRALAARWRLLRRWYRLQRRRDGTRKLVCVARIARKSRVLLAQNGFVMIQRSVLPDLRAVVQFLDVKVFPQSLYFWNLIGCARRL